MSTLRVDNLQGQTAGTNRYVVQVVQMSTTTEVTLSSSTATATGLSLAITPSSTNNKIFGMPLKKISLGASTSWEETFQTIARDIKVGIKEDSSLESISASALSKKFSSLVI